MTAEPVIGSPAWLQRRKELWDQQARDLVAALVKYEDEHPAEAICLAHVQRSLLPCRQCASRLASHKDWRPTNEHGDPIPVKPSPTEARRGY